MKKKKIEDEEQEFDYEEQDADYAEEEYDEDADSAKSDINVNDFNEVGHNLVKSVLSLYRSGKYFREKEFMAKKLLEVGYEAGRSVSKVALSTDYAPEARRSLDDLTFLIDSMVWDSIYTRHRVSDTIEAMDIANRLLNKTVGGNQQYQGGYASSNYNSTGYGASGDGFDEDYYG